MDIRTHPTLFCMVPEAVYGLDESENTIIQGDNLDVLTTLGSHYNGRIRCIYLDPPYNNKERYTHYTDRANHDKWQEFMRARLELLLPLLRADGSIWISIDDTQVHYLKILADEVLGRERFIHTIIWEHRRTRENRRVFSNNHEYILVYAKDATRFRETRNRVAASAHLRDRYKNPDNDPRGPWQSVTANAQSGHATPAQFYTVVAPNGRKHRPPKGRCWVYARERMGEAIAAGAVWFGRDGNGVPRLKRYLADVELQVTPETLWSADVVGTTMDAKRQLLRLVREADVFDTPKPEALLKRIIEVATNPGDIVLDPFLGSGTTAAVAHKMGRIHIGVEVGDHVTTHCIERLRQVVDGESGGISNSVGWRGGGSFRFVRHGRAPSEAAA